MNPDVETPVRLRAAVEADADSIAALEAQCPGAAQWERDSHARSEPAGYQRIVAERDGVILGFIIARTAADELEILNLAVYPAFRRQGIGTRLLEMATSEARTAGAKKVFLEVRESNSTALAFYRAHRFQRSGRRKGYYSQPCEDALALALSLE